MNEKEDKRPQLNKTISVNDFKEFYWLKKELVQFCRSEGLAKQGSKVELSTRIEFFLKTGNKDLNLAKGIKPISKFNWSTEKLGLKTIITDTYKNTENVREFFEEQLGPSFKFNVKFMKWMKEHVGQTLEDAIKEWKRLKLMTKSNSVPKEIAPQFEYNRYIRDFLKDNPDKKRQTAIQFWKIKRSKRGDNVYRKSDLDLL